MENALRLLSEVLWLWCFWQVCASLYTFVVQHTLSAHAAHYKKVKREWAFVSPDGDCGGAESVRNSEAQVLTLASQREKGQLLCWAEGIDHSIRRAEKRSSFFVKTRRAHHLMHLCLQKWEWGLVSLLHPSSEHPGSSQVSLLMASIMTK